MNIDIRLHTTFFRHPKTVKLLKKCGPEGVICLLKLWLWVRENKPDGIMGGPEDVEIAAEWTGEEGVYYSLLKQIKFIDKLNSGRTSLHNWAKRNPWAVGAVSRQLKAKKGGCAKHGKKCEKCQDDCPNSTQDLLQAEKPSTPSPAPSPSPTPKTKTLPGQALRLAGVLAEEILKHSPKMYQLRPEAKIKTIGQWAGYMDKLNRLNNHSWQDIKAVINWSQQDDFWHTNILSGKKLREQFDTLKLQMDKPTPQKHDPKADEKAVMAANQIRAKQEAIDRAKAGLSFARAKAGYWTDERIKQEKAFIANTEDEIKKLRGEL